MNKETIKKLTKNFPKDVVKQAPKGKFGSYVPHHLYTQRLVDVVGGQYNFLIKEIIRDKDNAVVGAVCRLEIEGLGVVEEIGDVDTHAISRNITESEVLKLAVSDGIKRCCMRFGIGLELWTGGVTEEEHYAGVEEDVVNVAKTTVESAENFAEDIGAEVKVADNLNIFIETFNDSADKKANAINDKPTIENIAEVFEDVVVVESKDKIVCDTCKTSQWVEDNSEKKESDPAKYGKIPTLVCSNYGSNQGCGDVIEW
jgi:hypothetical protein